MARLKVVVNSIFDTALPRDRILNVVHFNKNVPGAFDADAICTDCANAWSQKWFSSALGIKVEARAYDPGAPAGSPPVGYGVKNPTATPASSATPRDIALCLSFYAGQNRPRRRGRLYLPMNDNPSIGAKPTLALATKAMDLGDAISGIGGADVDWEVYSPTNATGERVTNMWVDDEYDTQRRRGLKPTTRWVRSTSG